MQAARKSRHGEGDNALGGPDNLQGVDYQISYSLLRVLEALLDPAALVSAFSFDSLTDDGEDITVHGSDSILECIQVKKRSEGYPWTMTDLRPVIQHFARGSKADRYLFITNGSANRPVRKMKLQLDASGSVSPSDLATLSYGDHESRISEVLSHTTIRTLTYASDDDGNPAKGVRLRIVSLLESAFGLDQPPQKALDLAWGYVFGLARQGQTVSLTAVGEHLAELGIRVRRALWKQIPNHEPLVTRSLELSRLRGHLRSGCIVVHGISGTGKTMVLADLARNLESMGKSVFWLSLNALISADDVLSALCGFLSEAGKPEASAQLKICERGRLAALLGEIMARSELYLFLDAVDSLMAETSSVIRGVVVAATESAPQGAVLLSAIDIPEWATQLGVCALPLSGFTEKETASLFAAKGIECSLEYVHDLHSAVAGHPLSVQLASGMRTVNGEADSGAELSQLSIESARSLLFSRAFSALSDGERDALISLSVMGYPFGDEEASAMLDLQIRPRYALAPLVRKGLLESSDGLFRVHDYVRALANAVVPLEKLQSLHARAAVYYQTIVEKAPALYTDIHKWGYHLERSGAKYALSRTTEQIRRLDNPHLEALWAIERFGFPFSFSDPTERGAMALVRSLRRKGLIRRNWNRRVRYMYTRKAYTLKNVDHLAGCLLAHFCLSRGLSNHLGYIGVFEPNYAHRRQGLVCGWEHCVEFYPLAPSDTDSVVAFLKSVAEQLRSGELSFDDPHVASAVDQLEEKAQAMTSEEIREALQIHRCPIFGHWCPGGPVQVTACEE